MIMIQKIIYTIKFSYIILLCVCIKLAIEKQHLSYSIRSEITDVFNFIVCLRMSVGNESTLYVGNSYLLFQLTILTSELHSTAPNHFGQKYFGTD